MAAKAVRFGDAFDVAQHETDEPVALAPYPIHDRATIDAEGAIEVHAEARRRCDGVGRIRGGDEQLARHAADAGAGGAIGAAFDEHCGRACGPRSAVRGKACRPGADDGDVNLAQLLICREALFMRKSRRRWHPRRRDDEKTAGKRQSPAAMPDRRAARKRRAASRACELRTCRIAPSRC